MRFEGNDFSMLVKHSIGMQFLVGLVTRDTDVDTIS